MPSFTGGPGYKTPFGKNVYLRSTQDVKTTSYTYAAAAHPIEVVDGEAVKVLQPGTVIAKITSGAESGKVGPYQSGSAGTIEVQTLTEGTSITAGSYIVNVFGVDTVPIAFDASLATFQAALRAAAIQSSDPKLAAIGDEIVVTGGPVATTPWTVTFNGSSAVDVPVMTVDATALTGTITVATATPGVAGAADGRDVEANIVGVNDTFLPWQLMYRDVEIAVVYEATCVAANCRELNAAGQWIAIQAATQTAIRALEKVNLTFV